MYLLDANAFMEASRLYYSFDLVPGFWSWLSSPEILQQVATVVAVRSEIIAGTGDLVDWATSLPEEFWLEHDEESLGAAAQISEWVMTPALAFTQAARLEFLSKADYHLIAQALAGDHTVVTMEKAEPDAKRIVKIPDVCQAFHVPCIKPFDAYRTLRMSIG